MSEAGKRLIESAKQALEFAKGDSDTSEFRIHEFEQENDENVHDVVDTQTIVAENIKNLHVIRRDDGWAVNREGKSQDSVVIKRTQREAINYAIEIARKNQVEVIIHGRDGQIRDRKDYSGYQQRRSS